MNHIKKFILLSFVALLAFTSCNNDDDPIVPDYTTYSFDALPTSVELEGPNYNFTVTLKRSTSTQLDLIDLAIADASGKFVLASSSVSFAVGESSKTIIVEPMDASELSIYDTYDITVSVVVPAGTTANISKNVAASVLPNWVATGVGNIDYGFSLAFHPLVFGTTSKAIVVEKDSKVDYYKCNDLYEADADILFTIQDGNVVIEDGQYMFTLSADATGGDPAPLVMNVGSAVYDSGAKTVTLTYRMGIQDSTGSIPGFTTVDVTDVITLP